MDEAKSCGIDFNPSNWEDYVPADIPHQDPATPDCGVHVCKTAERKSADMPLDFSAQSMSFICRLMVIQLLTDTVCEDGQKRSDAMATVAAIVGCTEQNGEKATPAEETAAAAPDCKVVTVPKREESKLAPAIKDTQQREKHKEATLGDGAVGSQDSDDAKTENGRGGKKEGSKVCKSQRSSGAEARDDCKREESCKSPKSLKQS
jgi:hypothetical protein